MRNSGSKLLFIFNFKIYIFYLISKLSLYLKLQLNCVICRKDTKKLLDVFIWYIIKDIRNKLNGGIMKNYNTGRIRNLALVGHSGSGKTSLTEAMLLNPAQ